jgi:hypothetical protein
VNEHDNFTITFATTNPDGSGSLTVCIHTISIIQFIEGGQMRCLEREFACLVQNPVEMFYPGTGPFPDENFRSKVQSTKTSSL